MIRKINTKLLKNTISKMCIEANTVLRKDIEKALRCALEKETKKNAKDILKILLENANIAKNEKIAICQDTGIVVCAIRMGQDVKIIGWDLNKAI
ncbi:MAG: fumarate hydratase, partial [Candidatus Omnitrophica bacterium]|nr:fumarate hydratase [Candidatus Omnitrophota bacterium]